ncbi:MAG: hypothetical protein HOC79_04495 [Euryarchaeota archaeon]|nr:hypothetical protein [Euryarchaeota archaeon]
MKPINEAWDILKEQQTCSMRTYDGIYCDRPAVYRGLCREHAADRY